jgi:hypothetical protein
MFEEQQSPEPSGFPTTSLGIKRRPEIAQIIALLKSRATQGYGVEITRDEITQLVGRDANSASVRQWIYVARHRVLLRDSLFWDYADPGDKQSPLVLLDAHQCLVKAERAIRKARRQMRRAGRVGTAAVYTELSEPERHRHDALYMIGIATLRLLSKHGVDLATKVIRRDARGDLPDASRVLDMFSRRSHP